MRVHAQSELTPGFPSEVAGGYAQGMRIRYIIETKSAHECPECAGSTRAHPVSDYKYTLLDGTPVTRQPGDVYYTANHLEEYSCDWDNCEGRHIICMCPDATWPEGHEWNITRRASNCTMKADRTHRCWVTHGRIEDGTLHVDKAGRTCLAGAGSIQTHNWHGFLHHGDLHERCAHR